MSKVNQSTAVAKLTNEEAIDALEQIGNQYGTAALATMSTMKRSVMLATGIRECKKLVTTIYDQVKDLAGRPLGFLTDKDKDGGYDPNAVIECLTEAALSGVCWTNNEFNIIAGKCYITKNGYLHKCNDIPGMRDLQIFPDVPKLVDGRTVVDMTARWKIVKTDDDGKVVSAEAFEHTRTIPIKVNSGMGDDGIIGKATRKMYATVHGLLTNSRSSIVDAEGEEDDLTGGEVTVIGGGAAELRTRLGAGAKEPPRQATAEVKPAAQATTPPASNGAAATPPTNAKPANPFGTKDALGLAVQEYLDAGGNLADFYQKMNVQEDQIEFSGSKPRGIYTEQFKKAAADLKAAAK